MNSTHLKSVLEIESSCFKQDRWSKNSIHDELQKETGINLVAVCDNRVLGYIFMYIVLDEGFITNLAVADGVRNCGVGSFLVRGILQQAVSSNLCSATLEVRESNAAALTVYQNCGFVAVGRRKAFYSNPCEDAVLMTYFLEEA
jgi:ribosomal-protein-alanine N-acetyltransferase